MSVLLRAATFSARRAIIEFKSMTTLPTITKAPVTGMMKLKLSSSPPVCDQKIIKTTSRATAPMTRPPFLVICELMAALLKLRLRQHD